MRELLGHQPLVLLFLTVGLGYLLSTIQVRGLTLGVAAVLFVGLGLGAWGGSLFELPEILSQLGLMLFIYALGLQVGPAFFGILRRRGLGITLLGLAAVGAAAGVAWAATRWGGVPAAMSVGLFSGGTFNIPSLAAINEQVLGTPLAHLPTIGYSLASPWGALLPIVVAEAAARLARVDLAGAVRQAEAESSEMPPPPMACNVRVEATSLIGVPLSESPLAGLPMRISRIERAGHQQVATGRTVLRFGDVVHLVGTEQGVREAQGLLGPELAGPGPETRRDEVDFRRMILSRHELVGRRLRELELARRWNAVATRVQRGDRDFVPGPDTVLERGDRLRVVAPTRHLEAIARHLGDSYRAVSETDYLSLSLGLVMGLIVGAIRIPMPGGVPLQLGLAGGPLVVALALGWLGRTGPIVWALPPSVNLALRQLGLVLFFAVVGLKAGSYFGSALAGEGMFLFGIGGAIALAASLVLMIGAMALLRTDWVTATGLLAGGQTQPALLTFVGERARSEAANVAYAAIMPTAMIAKIMVAQLLFWELTR